MPNNTQKKQNEQKAVLQSDQVLHQLMCVYSGLRQRYSEPFILHSDFACSLSVLTKSLPRAYLA